MTDDEMKRALVLDGEKLLALTGEDHGPFDMPKYSDPGRVLFRLYPIVMPDFRWQWYEVEILDYDSDSSVMWMEEGIGIDFWIKWVLDIELEGTYVASEITGEYHLGNQSYGEDDNEEWYFGDICRASDEEIETGALA